MKNIKVIIPVFIVLLFCSFVTSLSVNFFSNTTSGNSFNIQGISSFNLYFKNNTYLNYSRGVSTIIKDDPKYSPANSQNQFTVSVWIKIPTWNFAGQSDTSEYVNYIQKKNTSGTGCEWEFRIENATGMDTYARPCRLSFYVFNKTCGLGAGAYIQNNATINTCQPQMINKWINVIGGIGTDNNTFIYVNGQKNEPSTNNALSTYGVTTQDGIGNITIGKDLDSTSPYFQGQMQDLRIYNKTLTGLEVAQINDIGIARASVTKSIYNDSYMNFNGTDGYIQNKFNNFTNNITYTAWIKTNQYQQMVIIGSSNSNGMLWRIELDGKVRFFGNLTSGSNWATINITPNNWYFLAVTFDNNSRNASLFVNGVFNASTIITTDYLIDSGYMQIGRRGGTPNYFNGSMDNIGIYDKFLTQPELADLYNSGRNNNTNYKSSGLAMFYNFNESRYRVAVDTSSNRFDGDMFGETAWANDNIILGTLTYSLPTTNLVGNWKFNEGNGTRVYDSTIYGNNGTTNVTWGNDGINLLISSGNYTGVLTASSLVITWTTTTFDHLLVTLDYTLTEQCRAGMTIADTIVSMVGLVVILFVLIFIMGILGYATLKNMSLATLAGGLITFGIVLTIGLIVFIRILSTGGSTC